MKRKGRMLLRPKPKPKLLLLPVALGLRGFSQARSARLGGAQGFREAGTAPPKELQPSKDSIQFFTILGG